MATVAQLNVEIGARINELQKGLRAASRELGKAAKDMGVAGKKAGMEFSKNLEKEVSSVGPKLAGVGSAMSQYVSLPLAIMGGAAIQAAGEFESLRLAMGATFQNAGRSVADANKEIEALRKAALAPGLDFPQAVAASIRMQSVGLSAEKSRNVIIELANAIASTGGTAQNLESVTVQMSQMISKGKVLSQDLRIIQENLPIISSLMLKAFGTSNAEAIQELGITGKEFVEKITVEMSKLTRVEGGISNAIVNAGSAIKQFIASIGTELNKVFNIGAKSEQFATFLQDVQKWFSGLSNGTKQLAAEFALALLAAGPLLKIFSVLSTGAAQLVGGFRIAVSAIQSLNAGMAAIEAAAIRVKVAFGIIGVVAALGLAIYSMSDSFDAATFASDKFKDAQTEIISQTSKEIGTVNQLFDAIKDETKGKGEKGESIMKLLKLYPDYFKGMDLEGASVTRLTELQDGLNGSILRGVAERKKAEAVNSIYEKQAEILTRVQQLKRGEAVTVGESGLVNTGDVIRSGSIVSAVILKLEAQAAGLRQEVDNVGRDFDQAFGTMAGTIDPVLKKTYDLRDAYYAEKDALEENTKSTVKHVATAKEIAAAKKQHNKEAKDYNKLLKEKEEQEKDDVARGESEIKMLNEIRDAWVKEAQAMQDSLDLYHEIGNATDLTPLSPGGEQSISLATQPTASPGITAGITPGIDLKAQEALAQEWKDTYLDITQDAVSGAADIFNNSIDAKRDKDLAALEAEGKARLANAKGNAALEASIQADLDKRKAAIEKKAGLRRKLAALAEASANIAVAITKALGLVPFSLPFVVATAAAGAVQLGVIASQKFAAGTRDAPGGLALVGERGPELVNLPKHSQVFNAGVTSTALRGGGSNVNVTGEFRVQGTDLVLVLERTQNKLSRAR